MSTSNDRKEDGKNYNCDQQTLADEGYYLINTFTDTIHEKEINCQRAYLLKSVEEGRNNKYSEEYVEEALMQSADYKDFIKKMKKAIQTARNMRKLWLKNKSDYEDFKHDKELIGLKYETIRTRVNFIQISVIIVSTIITFLETVKEKIGIADSISMTIAPIILSTYIGLALAISRFFKLDDRKEELCKLDETMAFCMSGLRHRMRDIDRMKPLTAEQSLDLINQCDQALDDQNKDGLEETIGACKQKLDLAINLSEKVKYKNMLLKINLNKYIAEDNKKNLKEHRNHLSLYTYKSDVCCLWKYLCCDFNICRREFIDVERAYAEAEAYESGKPNNFGGRHKKNKHKDDKNKDDKHNNVIYAKVQKPTLSSKHSEEPIGPTVTTPTNNCNKHDSFSSDYVGLASHMKTTRRPSLIIKDYDIENQKVNSDNGINKNEDVIKETVNSVITNVLEQENSSSSSTAIIPKDNETNV